jgi:hypothetical protein
MTVGAAVCAHENMEVEINRRISRLTVAHVCTFQIAWGLGG